jgi:hypothetical protein
MESSQVEMKGAFSVLFKPWIGTGRLGQDPKQDLARCRGSHSHAYLTLVSRSSHAGAGMLSPKNDTERFHPFDWINNERKRYQCQVKLR